MESNDLIEYMQAANDVINPNGYFSHGRIEDVSLDFDKVPADNPTAYLIYLLPMRVRDDKRAGTTTYQCTVGCFKQDTHDSVPDDGHVPDDNPNAINRQQLIQDTERIVRKFVNYLDNNNDNNFRIPSYDFSPKYRDLAGTYTGHAVTFNVEIPFDDCDFYVAPPEP